MPATQTDILQILAIALVVVILLLFYLISSIINFNRVKNLRIDAARKLITDGERIKQEIARELHDEFSASLAAIRMKLQRVDAGGGLSKKLLNEADTQMKALMPKVHQIALNLLPPKLGTDGLKSAIREMVKNNSFPDLNTTVSIPSLSLAAETSLQIFRIIQEIFTNIIKHSSASECRITIKEDGRFLQLEIVDNGIGFDKDKVNKLSRGIGLSNIKSRVEIINGKLNLLTEENAGVYYNIKIPHQWRIQK